MEYFWYTKFNIAEATGGKDVGFAYFSLPHILELLLMVAIFVGMAFLYRKVSEKTRKTILIVLVCLMIADELFKDIGTIATNQFRLEFLPLHLCSINIFVALAYVIKPSKTLANWLYAVSLPGAVIALCLPSWKSLPILNFMHLHSYSVHVFLALFPVLLIAGGIKPDVKTLRWCALGMVCVCVPMFFLNKLLGTNFFFLNNNDPTSPLAFAQKEEFLGGYGYFLVMILGVALVWTLLYLPWVILEKKKIK